MSKHLKVEGAGTVKVQLRVPKKKAEFVRNLAQFNSVTMTEIYLYGIDLVENEAIRLHRKEARKLKK